MASTWDPSASGEWQADGEYPESGDSDSGELDFGEPSAARRAPRFDAEHSNVDRDDEIARSRNTLLSYFGDIASIRTLRKEEEAMLAKEMEAASFEMRTALLSVPYAWRHILAHWHRLQNEQRVTAKMSESYGSGIPEVGLWSSGLPPKTASI